MKLRILPKLLFLSLSFLTFQAMAQDMFVTGTGPLNVYSTQLYVAGNLILDDNSTLTINAAELKVDGGVDLGVGSVLYLRKGAQLIQTHMGVSQNTGTGVLSVFQEGAADVHQFNYWCSPVGNTTSSSTNNPFSITQLGRPISATATTTATSIHNSSYDGSSNPLNIEPYWINTFESKDGYYDWVNAGTGNIKPGYGFSMKGTSGTDESVFAGETTPNKPVPVLPVSPASIASQDYGQQRYDFRGKPNDGDIEILTAIDKFTLIGNPYPSAIDIEAFFEDFENFDTDGIAYFWEQGDTPSHFIKEYSGGYGVYAPNEFNAPHANEVYVPAVFYKYDGNGNPLAGGCANCNNGGNGNPDRGFVPVGQGFMIKGAYVTPPDVNDPVGDPGNGKVFMKNDFRVYHQEGGSGSGSVFSRKGELPKMPQIRFATTLDNGPISQMVQGFSPESTEGIDKGKDAINPNNYPSMVNFLVADNRCVISTVPFDISRKLPLIFDNQKEANFKMTVKEMINLDQVSNVYLHDKVSDLYMDIKNGFADITLPAGMNYDQYEITFQDNSNLGVNDIAEKSFVIYQDNSVKKMIVSNPMKLDIATCDLYDIAGKLVFSKNNLGIQSSYEFSTAELRDGIYITKITTRDNKTRSQKIIVKY